MIKEFYRSLIITGLYWLILVPCSHVLSNLNEAREVGIIELFIFYLLCYFPLLIQLILSVIASFVKTPLALNYLPILLQIPVYYIIYINYHSNALNYMECLNYTYLILVVANVVSIKITYKKLWENPFIISENTSG